jgi:flavodoxin
MKKCIVYYSKTGHTESVVKRFNDFETREIKASSDDPNQNQIELIVKPSIKDVDHLVFACPVHGFQACRIMKAYLEQLENLEGKTIDLFVTHHFRFAWLGGRQALKQLRHLVESKGGKVRYETSINWKSHKREMDIQAMIEKY